MKELDDAAQVIEEMRDSGLRRNLTPRQRAAIVLKCEALVSELRERARATSLANLKRGNEKPEVEKRALAVNISKTS